MSRYYPAGVDAIADGTVDAFWRPPHLIDATEKLCIGCGVVQDYAAFGKSANFPDGMAERCRVCAARELRFRLQHDPDYREKKLKQQRESYARHSQARQASMRERYVSKWDVRHAVAYAVKTGRLERPGNCSRCQTPCKPDGHHSDYNRPMDVEWLCRRCHMLEHRLIRGEAS